MVFSPICVHSMFNPRVGVNEVRALFDKALYDRQVIASRVVVDPEITKSQSLVSEEGHQSVPKSMRGKARRG